MPINFSVFYSIAPRCCYVPTKTEARNHSSALKNGSYQPNYTVSHSNKPPAYTA